MEVSLNKVAQQPDGRLLKCAVGEGASRLLKMRSLKPHEHQEYLKKKTQRLNLVEYYASGGKSSNTTTERPELRTPAEKKQPTDEGKWSNYLIKLACLLVNLLFSVCRV